MSEQTNKIKYYKKYPQSDSVKASNRWEPNEFWIDIVDVNFENFRNKYSKVISIITKDKERKKNIKESVLIICVETANNLFGGFHVINEFSHLSPYRDIIKVNCQNWQCKLLAFIITLTDNKKVRKEIKNLTIDFCNKIEKEIYNGIKLYFSFN